jgi:SAM-dependent methyltransferase
MGSVKLSVKGWNTTGARLALLLVIVLQTQDPKVGWPQEPAPARLDGEFAKQEKIYGSRGAEVPGGYVTNRGLSDYKGLLTADFCAKLSSLGSSDRWLDIGAGEGQALLDYYALDDGGTPTAKCVRSWPRARVVAMSIEDRQTDKWRQQAAIFGADRLRYVSGKRLRYYSREDLGTFQIITDVFGGFSYTEDLAEFLGKVLSLLETGGAFYTMVQSVHLEDGKDKPQPWYLTEMVDAAGRDVKVCSWLKQTTCVKVTCESKSDWDQPTELINIKKVCSDVSVPRTKLLKFEAGNPPGRQFQLER